MIKIRRDARGALRIFLVGGRANGKGVDFPDISIRNSID